MTAASSKLQQTVHRADASISHRSLGAGPAAVGEAGVLLQHQLCKQLIEKVEAAGTGKMASPSGQADLLEYIDFRSVECLNQQPAHPIGNALKQVRTDKKCRAGVKSQVTQLSLLQGYRDDQGLYLESDTDEQLLIHIPFNQGTCKLHYIILALHVGLISHHTM